ncbi:DmX-like protein 1, partial [Tetrabaena socialis]
SSNTKLADFLLRDFSQEEPRRSAAKNAFALLGQHRYELAASFFILGAQPFDAVSVLLRDRRDPQLALLVARLLDGGALGGPLARRLVEQVVSCLERAHCSTRTGLPGLLAAAANAGSGARPVDRSVIRRSRPAAASGVAVGGLACCPDAGVVSCGADGVVRYHPLAPQLLDLRRS